MKALFWASVVAVGWVSAASATIVTPTDPMGWTVQNLQGTGTAAITNTYADSGAGSLMLTTSGASDKADFVDTWGLVAGRTLGNISSLAYDIYRASTSTTTSFRAVAFRLAFYDAPSGHAGYLIYEPTYQPPGNSPVPTDQFITTDMTSGNFWMREFSGAGTITKYDVTLAQWASGTSQAPGAYVLNANTSIYAIEVGVGSGWDGTYTGAVDNVNVAFGSDTVNSNFELAATAVPEPASLALLSLGLVGVASARRRRAD